MGTQPFTPSTSPVPQTAINAPLAGLSSSQYQSSAFTYPLNLCANNAGQDHYMVFHINEQNNTQYQTTSSGSGNPTGANGQPIASTVTTNAASASQFNLGSTSSTPSTGGETSSTQGGTAAQPGMNSTTGATSRVSTTIVLYMPQDIQATYAADWQSTELGLAEDLVGGMYKGNTSIADMVKSAGVSVVKNAGNMATSFMDLNLKDAFSAATHLVINNHLEVVFNGIGFRQFHFNWRFTPTSEAEAVNIDNIIQAFKFYAAPEILRNTAGRFWIYPSTFDIQYYSNGVENQFLNKISTCALVNMQVNYTATGHWAAHRQAAAIPGAPSVCTDMALTFMELELMTKDRILNGY